MRPTSTISTERRARRRRWALLEVERVERLRRLGVITGRDADERVAALQDEIAALDLADENEAIARADQ